MFEKAARLKLRFETTKGILTVEDLWDLPLTSARGASLDDLAIGLNRQLKDSADVSFVEEASKPNELFQLKFDIVKHIIDTKKAENATAAESKAKAQKKQEIRELIARKKNEQLENSPVEELEALLASL